MNKSTTSLYLNPVTAAVFIALAGASSATSASSPKANASIGTEFQANSSTHGIILSPAVAMDAVGDFVVTWTAGDYGESDYNVYAQRFAADGSPQGDEITVSTTSADSPQSPKVVMDAAGEFVIAWSNNTNNESVHVVNARRYSTAGDAQGGEFQVNTGTISFDPRPNVAIDAQGDFVVAWSRTHTSGAGSAIDVFAQRYTTDGNAQGSEFLVNTGTDGNQVLPAVAMDAAGDFAIAWQSFADYDSDGEIFVRRFDSTGTALGDDLQVSKTTHEFGQLPVSIAMDAAGDFVVTWVKDVDNDTSFYYDPFIHARRYRADGTAQAAEFQVTSIAEDRPSSPRVAMDASGDFAITWQNYNSDSKLVATYVERYAADGSVIKDRIKANTTALKSVSKPTALPATALDAGGDLVVTWRSLVTGDAVGTILAQRYTRNAPLDLGAGLVLSPTDAEIDPGSSLTMTASVINSTTISTLSGNTTIDSGITAASGITSTITLPPGVAFVDASGSNWICGDPVSQVLTCSYGATLAAGEVTPAITVDVTAAVDPAVMNFTNLVSENQPESTPADNTTIASDKNTADSQPIAKSIALAIDHNTARSGSLKSTDADSDSVTYVKVAAPKHGTLSLTKKGGYTYTPAKDYSGTDSFTFTANDGTLTSAAAKVSITVTEHTPTAAATSFSMTHNTSHTGALKGTDADAGDKLVFTKVTGPAHGSLTLSSSGSYTYKPTANYKGADKFTFHVNDGSKSSATATVTITVK